LTTLALAVPEISLGAWTFTSLCCHWQTRVTQCLKPMVL